MLTYSLECFTANNFYELNEHLKQHSTTINNIKRPKTLNILFFFKNSVTVSAKNIIRRPPKTIAIAITINTSVNAIAAKDRVK